MEDSCFSTNQGSQAGSIYVSTDASLPTEQNRNNFFSGNTADGSCGGAFLAGGCQAEGVCNGICLLGDAAFCQKNPAPTVSPTFAPSLPTAVQSPRPTGTSIDLGGCASTWADLVLLLENGAAAGTQTLLICPGAALTLGDADGPMVISDGTDVTIQCGANGDIADDCSISGGAVQFELTGAPDSVTFRGLQMRAATVVSVLAAASASTRAEFKRCQWEVGAIEPHCVVSPCCDRISDYPGIGANVYHYQNSNTHPFLLLFRTSSPIPVVLLCWCTMVQLSMPTQILAHCLHLQGHP